MVTAEPSSTQVKDWTTAFTVSKSSTSVTNDAVRLGGFHTFSMTASAGNTPVVRIVNGSASTGSVVLHMSATAYNSYRSWVWPYVRFPRGLYADVSGSATGVSVALFYVPDRA